MRSIKPELESLKKIKLHLNNVWDLPGFTAESCPPSRRQYWPGKICGAGQSYKTSGNLHPRKANKEGTKAILTCRAIKTWAFITEQVTQFKYQVETETLTHAPRPGCGAGSRWCPGRAACVVTKGRVCAPKLWKDFSGNEEIPTETWDWIKASLLAVWFSLKYLFVTLSNQISSCWQVNALQHLCGAPR